MNGGGTKSEGQTFDHWQLASLLAQMERLVERAFPADEVEGKPPPLPPGNPRAGHGGWGR